MDVDGLEVVGEEPAGLVVLDLADEAGLHAEGGDARGRVGAEPPEMTVAGPISP